MIKYSCIIIEDEPLALEKTKGFVLKTPFLNLLGTFDNALEGLAFLKLNKVDILFLDINMDELSGIELLESSRLDCQVIITTAYSEYALKGYELDVTDYLLKPFSFERFLQAVTRIQDKSGAVPSQALARQCIFVKTENRLEKVNLDEILFIEGMRDYRRIHTVNKRIMTLQNFSEFEQLIPANVICRVHKSYMVAIGKIDAIERSRIKISNQIIPISETYRAHFFSQIHG
ncbi:MAG: DNA-binding response regulator [Flavobacterium sp. BFFFF1]|uniref:LytR/AlgR family response regulator transcription factor n=1 Tax=unclassified Flavobacterium TaxID=196869 RepID=UPI000BC75577|nr:MULTISPECIES: LytTR family DNA-binding domain-containing protein [unclassified Flavobacterium]OYU80311.1 MAG: DNA-binding response regulator [Flavobacterium sp. BFFFF1]